MSDKLVFRYNVEGNDFTSAGQASVQVKKNLRQIGGPGIEDIEKAMQAGYSTAPDNIRSLGFGAGMGLPNMKKNSDSMEINSTVGVGTRIVMRVKI